MLGNEPKACSALRGEINILPNRGRFPGRRSFRLSERSSEEPLRALRKDLRLIEFEAEIVVRSKVFGGHPPKTLERTPLKTTVTP